jgi:ATP-binding cassette subfamily B protein
MRAQKWWVRLALLLTAGSVGASLSLSLLIRGFIDNGLVDQTVPLRSYVAGGATLSVVAFLLNVAGRQLIQRLVYQLEFDLRSRLYRTFQSSDARALDLMGSGQLVTRSMTDVATLGDVMTIVPFVLAALPAIIGFSVVILAMSPPMGIITVVSLPINVWLLNRFRRRMRALSWLDLNERAEVAAAIDEPVRGIRVVKAFGQEEREQQRVAGVALRAYRFAMSRVRLLARFDLPMRVVPVVTQTVVLIVGVTLVANGQLSLGTFVLVFQTATLVTGAASVFGEGASVWQYLVSAQSRLADVIDMAGRGSRGRELPPPSDGLRLEDVSVTIDGHPVLSGVDLAVGSGQLVAVHGSPGSGKSTLAAVIAGLLRADAGGVVLDGTDPHGIDLDHRHRAVRVVSEESFLFAATVRENLELAVPDAEEDETLRRALWAAAADGFVDELPEGLDAHVGDRGLTLSGGQRQRLALARALVAPPRVLVLDDALSAVNPSMEVEILHRIRSVAPDTAVVCFSRRTGASTIADAVLTLPDPVEYERVAAVETLVEAEQIPASRLELERQSVVQALAEENPRVDEPATLVDRPVAVRGLIGMLRGVLLLALIGASVEAFGALWAGILFGNLSDLLRDGKTGEAIVRGLVVLVAGVTAAVGAYVYRIQSQQVVQSSLYLMRRRIFGRLSRLGIDYYDRELPGEVAARVVNDLDRVKSFIESRLFLAISQITMFTAGATVIAILSPRTSLVVLGIAVALMLATAGQYHLADRALTRVRTRLGGVVTAFEEDFAARREVSGLGARTRRATRFLALSWRLRAARRRATFINTVFASLFECIGNFGGLLVLFTAGGFVLSGDLSVGTALTLSIVTQTATGLLLYVGGAYGEFLTARVSWRRLAEPYDVPVLPVDEGAGQEPPRLAEGIRFSEVSFGYPSTGRPVLRGVSFDIPANSVLGLVGYTGAGKSSIGKLLTRTYDADAGAVLFDGTDIRAFDLKAYRRRVGVVPQDAFLFRGTVASNISYGLDEPDMDRVEMAAEAVGGWDMLAGLPDGFDHVVEEDGQNLTAAQRQLIALARAWIIRPDVLILDEATSCLDAELERRVLEAVATLGCTTLMITHREHVAASCDHVVVLGNGVVVEAGHPSELIGTGGAYDRLWVVEPVALAVAQ